MRIALFVLAGLLGALPAAADFSSYYKGTQLDGGKEIPVTAQFSVEKGRVAMIMKGSRAARMLFLEKEEVLRIVDDDGKTYVDLDRAFLQQAQGDVGAAMAEAKGKLDQLPPEQRAMAEKMMQGAMGAAHSVPKDVYVRTEEKQTIQGYECTRVNIMAGEVKKAEYWGTTSDDFKLAADERNTMLAMQSYLRDYLIQVASMGGGDGASTRAFQWDTSVEGFPLVTRCFNGDQMTLDLHLESKDRTPLSEDLFKLPSGYKKRELPTAASLGGRKHRKE